MMLSIICVIFTCIIVLGSGMPIATRRYTRPALRLQRCATANRCRLNTQLSMSENIEADEEQESFQRIAKNYLVNKFKDCQGEDCRLFCSREEMKSLLRFILPPCSPNELEKEVQAVLQSVADTESVDVDEFLEAALKNTYWKDAGPLVVKELIFLDCLNEYYYNKRNILDDDDYNELKESLTWDGSSAATLSGKEAHFISAVAASRRGESLMSDADYGALKVCHIFHFASVLSMSKIYA